MSRTTAPKDATALGDLAERCLARHRARHAASPKRAATAYLRVALAVARQLAQDEATADAGQRLMARVITEAVAAEEACFAAGGNSAPYLSLLVAAHRVRVPARQPSLAPSVAAAPLRRHEALPLLTASSPKSAAHVPHGKPKKPGRHQTAFAQLLHAAHP